MSPSHSSPRSPRRGHPRLWTDYDPRVVARMVDVAAKEPGTQGHGGDRRSSSLKCLVCAVRKVARELGLSDSTVRRLTKVGRDGTDELLAALKDLRVSLIDAAGIAESAKGEIQVSSLKLFLKTKPEKWKRLKAAVRFEPETFDEKLAPQKKVGKGRWKRPVPKPPFASATFISTQTCAKDCLYRQEGCYAKEGRLGVVALPLLNVAALGLSADEILEEEAHQIDLSFPGSAWPTSFSRVPDNGDGGKRDLRLHVAGDVAGSVAAVERLARAAKRWKQRGGGEIWTYTHDWRRVPRRAWGVINVLASVETPAEIADARERGYAALLTVEKLKGRSFYEVAPNTLAVPCPGVTSGGKITCVECRLCLRHEYARVQLGRRPRRRLYRAIAIPLHGRGRKRAALLLRRKNNRRK